jgi:hypothetical protein
MLEIVEKLYKQLFTELIYVVLVMSVYGEEKVVVAD